MVLTCLTRAVLFSLQPMGQKKPFKLRSESSLPIQACCRRACVFSPVNGACARPWHNTGAFFLVWPQIHLITMRTWQSLDYVWLFILTRPDPDLTSWLDLGPISSPCLVFLWLNHPCWHSPRPTSHLLSLLLAPHPFGNSQSSLLPDDQRLHLWWKMEYFINYVSIIVQCIVLL